MKVTIYGYRENFLVKPTVKVFQDGRLLGEVASKGVLVLDGIAENAVLTFKSSIRSTQCVVSSPNIVLSFNRMSGHLEAIATENVDQAMMMHSAKDSNSMIIVALLVLVGAVALVVALRFLK